MGTNDAWLAQVREEAIDPDRPICDPHHHLGVDRHGVEPTYLLPDFLVDINGSGHNVVSTVFIETFAMFRAEGPEQLKPVGEVEFINGIAAVSASGKYGPTRVCAGIIGYADFRLGKKVAETLDMQIAVGGGSSASRGRFKGTRFGVTWDAHPDVPNHRTRPNEFQFREPKFREGFAELGARGLTFEAWCFHPQIPEITDLARAFPDQIFILDHFGGPVGVGPYRDKRDETFAKWHDDITDLASCPNVYAKLGGLQMDVNGFNWHKRQKPPTSEELLDATRCFHEHTLAVFGTKRCMFESNFPVDK